MLYLQSSKFYTGIYIQIKCSQDLANIVVVFKQDKILLLAKGVSK